MASDLDGVRPKNSVCLSCGYGLGGIEIKGGVIVCPECAVPARFELRRPRPVNPTLLRAIGLAIGFMVFALLVLAGAYFG